MVFERRNNFRIPLAAEQAQGLIRVGQRSLPVQVLDTSAGGFAVVADETVQVAPGQTLQLRTAAGWHEVRVIHADPDGFGTRLGLERVRDILPEMPSRVPSIIMLAAAVVLLGLSGVLYWQQAQSGQTRPLPRPSELLSILGEKADRAWRTVRGA
jgi:hypothetical protein